VRDIQLLTLNEKIKITEKILLGYPTDIIEYKKNMELLEKWKSEKSKSKEK